MQPANSSPLKPSLGLPIPASPADSGFLPRREFLPSSSRRPLSTFGLLAFTNTSSIRLSAFPPPVIHLFHKFFEDRKLLKIFRDNKASKGSKDGQDKESRPTEQSRAHPTLGGARTPGEAEDLAEFTLNAKFWSNPKTMDTEKLLVQLLVLLNSQGYSLLTAIDFGREPSDKLTLVFEKPETLPLPNHASLSNGYGQNHAAPGHHHQNSTGSAAGSAIGSASGTTGGPVKQLLFGLSFTSQTSFRCINPPLESTPGILLALRNAWPKGIESENKVSEGCYEFKLKGYSFFAEDTFQTDSLELTISLLKSLQKLQFTLVASLCLASSHSRSKDLWIFSTNDTDALSPMQILSSISASPVAYAANGMPLGLGQAPAENGDESRYGTMQSTTSHLRSASADAFHQQTPGLTTPGHQRNATSPGFGAPGLALAPSASIGSMRGGASPAPRQQGSVLVKKSPSAKASPRPPGGGALPPSAGASDSNLTSPGVARNQPSGSTPPKAPTPPATSGGVSQYPMGSSTTAKPGMMMMGPPSSKPMVMGVKYPHRDQQQQGPGGQTVLYSTPTSGNVLYSTPPSSPPASYNAFPTSATNPGPYLNVVRSSPPTSPRAQLQHARPSSPSRMGVPPGDTGGEDEDGHTPPLLSSTAFRDTISDQDTIRESTFAGSSGGHGAGGGSSAMSMKSGRSGESFDPTWTGTGGLGAVGAGLAPTLEEEDGIEEDQDRPEDKMATPSNVPGAWVDSSASPVSTKSIPGPIRRETERQFGAKVEGAQIVTVPSPPAIDSADPIAVANLGRRKSQEAIVQSVPPSTSVGPNKADGWVMINVSGGAGGAGGQQEQQLRSKSPNANMKPPPGPLRALNASPASSSSVDSPPSIAVPPPTSYIHQDQPSADESSSSVDRSNPPSNLGHGTSASSTGGGAGTGSKSRSGFRRLFSREKKRSGEKLHQDETSAPATPAAVFASPTKKGRSYRNGDPEEPAKADRKMTID